MKIKRKNVNLLFLIFIVSFIFLCIFRFLFHGYLPFFMDIGADTYNMNYISNAYAKNELAMGKIMDYTFSNGLGTDNFNLLFLNFIQVMYYIFPTVRLGIVMTFGSYLCVVLSAIFSFFIFRTYKADDRAALIGAVIWAFSGYLMLWGQHFDFGAAYAMVTLYILLLARCRFEKLSDMYGVIIGLAQVLACSYYWLYMVGILTAIYVIAASVIRGKKSGTENKQIALTILKKEGLLLFSGIVACAIGFFLLYRGLESYLLSTRTAAVTTEPSEFGIFYNMKYFMTDIARFFSDNLVGIGNGYTGAYNYYEGTMLCTSGLALYSITFFLVEKKNKNERLRRLSGVLLILLSVSIPLFTKYMTFNDKKQRWTFAIVFLIIASIVYMLNKLFRKMISFQNIKKMVGHAWIAFSCLFIILLIGDRLHYIDVIKREAIYVTVPFLAFGILLLIYGRFNCDRSNANLSRSVSGRRVYALIMVTLVVEMVFLNYGTYNKRMLLTQDDINNIFYDGSENAAAYLKKTDVSLYRVSKTYMTASYNESKIQGYNGFSDYSAVEKSSVAEYMMLNGIPFAEQGTYSRASKYISIPWTDYVTTSLLGMKYVMSKDSLNDTRYLSKVDHIDGINIYSNQYALPFGYLYTNKISGSDYAALSTADKRMSLLSAYYYTKEARSSNLQMPGALNLPDEEVSSYRGEETDSLSGNQKAAAIKTVKNHNKIVESLNNLKRNSATDVSFSRSIYKAGISNNTGAEAMMCVPVFVEREWKAYIDGQPVSVNNINGGLIGIKVPKGEHHIELHYDRTCFYGCIAVSAVSLAIFVIWGIVILKKRNKSIDIRHAVVKTGCVGLSVLIVLGAFYAVWSLKNHKWRDEWTVTQYSSTTGEQAMCYTIEDKDGNLSIIDGGYDVDGDISQMLDIIRQHNNHVSSWVVTHPHHDHIGVFNNLYPKATALGITIDRVYATNANRNRIVKMARSGTQDVETYDAFAAAVSGAANVTYVNKGDMMKLLPGLRAKVLHAWDENVNNTDCNPCNNGSIMFKVYGKQDTMLFCADNEAPIEKFIIDQFGPELKADYVQCGHHASTGLSTDFYDKVGAKKRCIFRWTGLSLCQG